MKIYVMEDKNIVSLVKKVNESEEKDEAYMIGSISNYIKENMINVGYEEESMVDLQPVTVFYATMRTGKRNSQENF